MGAYFRTSNKRKKRARAIWNILTIVVLLGVVCQIIYFVSVFRDPRMPFNPFPPEPSPTVFFTETPTITPIPRPPTWTPSPTIEPSPTRTRAPTWTPGPGQVTNTRTPTPTDTPTPTFTPTPMPASAEISYVASTSVYPDSGCNWFGVGGVVLGIDGKPLGFQIVRLGGTLQETPIDQMRLSGSAQAFGASGFEFVLGSQPIASTQTLWIQLLDNTGQPLSEKIYFDTFAACDKNLVKVKFQRTR